MDFLSIHAHTNTKDARYILRLLSIVVSDILLPLEHDIAYIKLVTNSQLRSDHKLNLNMASSWSTYGSYTPVAGD